MTGGLLVDLGVLSLKPSAIPASYYPSVSSPIPRLPPSHPAIVEWRALTVIELCVTIRFSSRVIFHSLTSAHPSNDARLNTLFLFVLSYCIGTNQPTNQPNQGSNRRENTRQAQLVQGTAHPRAGARKRNMERGSGNSQGKATGVRWSAD